MKGKLSAGKYIKNNKKQVSIMIIIISLTFTVMYIINILLMATAESFKISFEKYPKRVCFAQLSLDTYGFENPDEVTTEQYEAKREETIEKLKAHEGIENVYFTQFLNYRYSAIVGSAGEEFPLLDKEEIPSYLKHMNAELIDGRMPENDGEILVDTHIMKNQHYSIGDNFQEESFGDTFKVVGVLESECFACAGTPKGYSNNGFGYVILCDEKNCDMKKVFADIGITITDLDGISDINTGKNFIEKQVEKEINASLSGIIIVVMAFLAIAIMTGYISSMRNRMNEYCLYTSLGFSKKEVYGMMMREIFFNFIIGIIGGAVITAAAIFIIIKLVFEPLGLMYGILYPMHLLKITASFAAIVGVLQIPAAVIINNIKTIDRIEE